MASKHDLEHLVRQATGNIAAEYERMRQIAKEDPGTSGDQGEENWAELLVKWLPGTFHVVTKGRILSSTGQTSDQIDVLVLSPSYPRGLLTNKLYIAAGVLASFECKRTLRREHIQKAVRSGVKLARMTAADSCVSHHIIYGLLAHSYGIGSDRTTPAAAVGAALAEADAKEVTDPRECLDFVCVPNLGTWSLTRAPFEKIDTNSLMANDEGRGTLMTFHMGPLDGNEFDEASTDTDAFGRFLTGLLRRLGEADESIAAIAKYFEGAGLYGVGRGRKMREWPFTSIPEDLRRVIS
jgi:hypothetical protein